MGPSAIYTLPHPPADENAFKRKFLDNAAIIAMQGMLCGMNDWNETLLAHSAYEMAEAMWDERAKRLNGGK